MNNNLTQISNVLVIGSGGAGLIIEAKAFRNGSYSTGKKDKVQMYTLF